MPFPEPKHEKSHWNPTGQESSKSTWWLQCTTKLLHCSTCTPTQVFLMKKLNFNEHQQKKLAQRSMEQTKPDLWSRNWVLLIRAEQIPPPYSAASEMFNFLSSSLNTFVRKGLSTYCQFRNIPPVLETLLINKHHLSPELQMLKNAVQFKGQPLRSKICRVEISLGTVEG